MNNQSTPEKCLRKGMPSLVLGSWLEHHARSSAEEVFVTGRVEVDPEPNRPASILGQEMLLHPRLKLALHCQREQCPMAG